MPHRRSIIPAFRILLGSYLAWSIGHIENKRQLVVMDNQDQIDSDLAADKINNFSEWVAA